MESKNEEPACVHTHINSYIYIYILWNPNFKRVGKIPKGLNRKFLEMWGQNIINEGSSVNKIKNFEANLKIRENWRLNGKILKHKELNCKFLVGLFENFKTWFGVVKFRF